MNLLSWLRASKAAAWLALVAILARAIIPTGWMPSFSASSEHALSIIICTAYGPLDLAVGADGQPQKSPAGDRVQEHPLCHLAAGAHWSPPATPLVILLPNRSIGALPSIARDKRAPLFPARLRYPSRAPPSVV